MNVIVSSAELSVFIELQKRHLTGHMLTQHPFIFNPKTELVHGTTVDFYFTDMCYAVFIDGPPHLKERQETKDEHITKALERRGIKVDRFPYKTPLRKRRLKEICDTIQTQLTRQNQAEVMRVNREKAPQWV